MKRVLFRSIAAASAALALLPATGASALGQEAPKIVTTLTTYAAIAREVAGERGEVRSIAEGDENPHFVKPKPSYVVMLREADLFVTTGLDLELWVPTLLDKANNRKIYEGGPGYVTAYTNVRLLDVPAVASRAAGDIHIYGNPHIHTDPINGIIIARNILRGLIRISPGDADYYREREREFERRILRSLFGEHLVEILGSETLLQLANSDRWWDFLSGNEFEGRPLTDYLGGWLEAGAPFRGREMICYHKQWAYFSSRFQIACAGFVESKLGIPPSPRHVESIIEMMENRSIPVLFAANFWDARRVRAIAERVGAAPVIVPEHVGGEEDVDTYFDLIDVWVTRLAAAFGAAEAAITR